MQLKLRTIDDTVICAIKGEMTISSVEEISRTFDSLLAKKTRKVIINCKHMTYIDSSGLAGLLRFSQGLAAGQGVLLLCAVSPKILSLLAITKLDTVFRIFETEEEALRGSYGY